eukprot:GHVQ01012706.1.p1 GENE.GHVQ01012706.1~~GHVQ01012706.1.p1  ORF type:complete len:224 (+),score=33.64 GHVQ01012706.1:460-1131(+)
MTGILLPCKIGGNSIAVTRRCCAATLSYGNLFILTRTTRTETSLPTVVCNRQFSCVRSGPAVSGCSRTTSECSQVLETKKDWEKYQEGVCSEADTGSADVYSAQLAAPCVLNTPVPMLSAVSGGSALPIQHKRGRVQLLKDAMVRFRDSVKEDRKKKYGTMTSTSSPYEGWPPKSRVIVGEVNHSSSVWVCLLFCVCLVWIVHMDSSQCCLFVSLFVVRAIWS